MEFCINLFVLLTFKRRPPPANFMVLSAHYSVAFVKDAQYVSSNWFSPHSFPGFLFPLSLYVSMLLSLDPIPSNFSCRDFFSCKGVFPNST